MQIKKMFIGSLTMAFVFGAMALQVDVVKQGAAKVTVTLQVSGSPDYLKCLKRNLELSGWFRTGQTRPLWTLRPRKTSSQANPSSI